MAPRRSVYNFIFFLTVLALTISFIGAPLLAGPIAGEGDEKGDKKDEAEAEIPPPPSDNLAIPKSVDSKVRTLVERAVRDLKMFRAQSGKKKLSSVIRDLKKQKKDPKVGTLCKYWIAVGYNIDEDYKKARKFLGEVLQENPKFFQAWVEQGTAAEGLHELDKALAHYNQALSIYGYDAGALDSKATLLVTLGRFKEADDVYVKLARVAEADDLKWIPFARAQLARVINGPSWSTTYTATTENFIVRTGVSQDLADLVAHHAEQIRKLYAKYFMDVPRTGRKFTITVYRDKGEYVSNGGPQSAGGHYSPYTRDISTFDRPDLSDALCVLYHEGLHLYLHDYAQNIPQWFNEGLGDFFGGALISSSGKKAKMSANHWRVDLIKLAIQRRACPAVRVLMNMSRREMYGANAGIHYAQAWSIVHFCIMGGKSKYQSALKGYFKAMRKGMTRAEAYSRTFGKLDMKRFQTEWEKHVDRLPSGKEVSAMREKILGE